MENPYSILYVDDEEGNLTVFQVSFKNKYQVFTANSALKALDILQENPIHLIITDQKMPHMTGLEFLRQVVVKYPNIVNIILTGYADIGVIIEAVNECQIFRYLSKPWDRAELQQSIAEGLKQYQLRVDKQNLLLQLREQNENLEKLVAVRTQEILKQKEEHSKKELISLKMQIQEKNQLLENLKTNIRNLQNELHKSINLRLNELFVSIDRNLKTQQEWENFSVLLGQVHEGFYARLREKYPKLTDNDLRICAYLRLNMSTKEIANLTHTSVRGIETNRYRIRQRMGIEGDEKLLDILAKI